LPFYTKNMESPPSSTTREVFMTDSARNHLTSVALQLQEFLFLVWCFVRPKVVPNPVQIDLVEAKSAS